MASRALRGLLIRGGPAILRPSTIAFLPAAAAGAVAAQGSLRGFCSEAGKADAPVSRWGAQGFAAAAVAAGFAFASPTIFGPDVPSLVPQGASMDWAGTKAGPAADSASPSVVFVLGGPGSGKGTQCARLVADYGFVHLSAGDLLRDFIKGGSRDAKMVNDMIKEGKIVPSSVTVKLLQSAMAAHPGARFLIDGFPRNAENREAFVTQAGDCDLVLFYDCPEEVMTARLLGRNQGRVDDNLESIKKRFETFQGQSLPVVAHYGARGKVAAVKADRPADAVYVDTQAALAPLLKADALATTRAILACIDAGDFAGYAAKCDPAVTCFESEAQGQAVVGLPFHKFYFEGPAPPVGTKAVSTLSAPAVTLAAGGRVAVVAYVRLVQSRGPLGLNATKATEETRVYERRGGEYVMVHLHRSPAPTH